MLEAKLGQKVLGFFFRFQQQSSWDLVHSSVTLHFLSVFPHFTFFSSYSPNLYLSPTLTLLPFLLGSPPPPSSQSFSLPPIVPYTGLEPLQDVINKSCRAERRRRPRIRFGARLPPCSTPTWSKGLKFKSMCWIFMGSWRCCARTYQYFHVELMKAFQRLK